MIRNAVLRKAVNQTAFALAQGEFFRIRTKLDNELRALAETGASTDRLLEVLRHRAETWHFNNTITAT